MQEVVTQAVYWTRACTSRPDAGMINYVHLTPVAVIETKSYIFPNRFSITARISRHVLTLMARLRQTLMSELDTNRSQLVS